MMHTGRVRTTVTFDEAVLTQAKRRASEAGESLSDYVNRAVQRALVAPDRPAAPAVPIFSDGTGVRPGVDLSSNVALLDLMDDA